MGWFGLFDLLRFQTDDAVPSSWALPGSRLRVADRHLAALYHGAVTDAGQHYCADLFDLASHHIARSSPPQTGVFHVDMRMTGRPARLLFGSDHTQSIVAWHAPTATASVRLAGAEPPVEFPQVDLPKLLQLTLPICQIATLSAWVEDFHGVEAVMKLLDPWLTTSSRAIVRLPQSALAAMLARLPAWPARCVAVVPCSNAAQKTGGNETVDDVIVCFQDISAQTPQAATAAEQKRVRVIAADTWNDKPHGQRARSQGGVGVQMPSDHPRPISGLPITLLGDAPANPAGTSFAAMQSRPFQPSTGFDYLLDISAATILRRDTSLFIVPQHGPAVIDPAQALQADADDFSPDAIKRFHAAHHLSETGGLATSSRLAATLATRPTLLLSTATSPLSHLTQSWPNLQHLFELCDRERLALDEVDVLVPDAATPWVIDSLLHSGLTPGQIRHDFDRVLFRRLLVANPASQASGSPESGHI